MKYFYTLRIDCDEKDIDLISKILKKEPNSICGWAYEVEVSSYEKDFDFILEFTRILAGKEAQLSLLGISPDDISFWMIYEYDDQCNMEFDPDQLKIMGSKGYRLCISCYQADD